MRHWTQDGAHILAYVATAAGLAGVFSATSGPAMAGALLTVAFGVAGAVGLRALETRDGFMQAMRAETNSKVTQAELEVVKARLAELEKPSLTSRVGSGRIAQGRPEY